MFLIFRSTKCEYLDGSCLASPRWVSLLVAEIYYPDATFPNPASAPQQNRNPVQGANPPAVSFQQILASHAGPKKVRKILTCSLCWLESFFHFFGPVCRAQSFPLVKNSLFSVTSHFIGEKISLSPFMLSKKKNHYLQFGSLLIVHG